MLPQEWKRSLSKNRRRSRNDDIERSSLRNTHSRASFLIRENEFLLRSTGLAFCLKRDPPSLYLRVLNTPCKPHASSFSPQRCSLLSLYYRKDMKAYTHMSLRLLMTWRESRPIVVSLVQRLHEKGQFSHDPLWFFFRVVYVSGDRLEKSFFFFPHFCRLN